MQGWAIVENGKPLQDVNSPTPSPTGTQVLLEVMQCGVCHSDLYFQDGYYELGGGRRLLLSDRGVKLPIVPGHETVGVVVALGPMAHGVSLGDRRIVYPWTGCGACSRCRSGDEHLCFTPRSLGVYRDGGYGSHVLTDRPEHLVDFGDLDSALAATYACSGLTAYSAVKKLGPLAAEDVVVVVGAGGLGLAAINILRSLGAPRILVVDVSTPKLAAGEAAGAIAVDGRAPDQLAAWSAAAGGPITGVLDFVASGITARTGIDALARGGSYIPIGLYGGEVTLSLPTIPLRAIAIRGSYTGSLAELKELVEMAKTGKLSPTAIERVAHTRPNQALDRLRRGEVAGRLVLDRGIAD